MSDEPLNSESHAPDGAIPSQNMMSEAMAVEAARTAIDFEALFRAHYRRVYGVLYRLVGDEADDLAQEVFLQLYLRPPRGDEADLAGWLYRVATNLGYNALRAARRREAYGALIAGLRRLGRGQDDAAEAQVAWQPAEPDPEAWAQQRDEQRRVRAALAKLKRQQAALLVLRYNGLSYREIAQALGIAAGSVGTLLARAERAFEKAFGSRG